MGKFLLLWPIRPGLVPADPKERATGWGMLMEMVKQDISKGLAKDWGIFSGTNKGYWVFEGSNL
jgi:hypothetical protein